jgi:hypothetical protein
MKQLFLSNSTLVVLAKHPPKSIFHSSVFKGGCFAPIYTENLGEGEVYNLTCVDCS